MRHSLILVLIVLSATLAGCTKPDPTYPDKIPEIPPGRSSPTKGDGAAEGTSSPAALPKPPG